MFNDVKGSAKDPALLGPPSVEYAPHGRVPTNRGRKDLRQGTIDQDQEFIDFLESLTNPITKSTPVDQASDAASKSKEKVTITPLIQYLRDKKANKGKEIVSAPKGSKHTRQDSNDNRSSPVQDRKLPKAESINASSPDQRSAQAIKVEKAARDVVRVINKQAVDKTKGSVSSSVNPKTAAIPSSNFNAPLGDKRRERGNASAAAKILQRDLGLTTNNPGKGERRGGAPAITAKSLSKTMSSTTSKQNLSPAQQYKEAGTGVLPDSNIKELAIPFVLPTTTAIAPKSPNSNHPPRGPAASRSASKTNLQSDSKAANSSSFSVSVKHSSASPNATQAFLKHANPSQGITEVLLEEAFASFGTVKKVEIDKKKGFAYVDFAEPQGLQDAIKASPIKVAQGQVVVLERKVGPSLQTRNVRTGSHISNNRGGGAPTVARGGGGTQMGPRGGRGGSIRRGGRHSRGGGDTPNPNTPKLSQTTAASAIQKTTTISPEATIETTALVSAESGPGTATIPAVKPAATASDTHSTPHNS